MVQSTDLHRVFIQSFLSRRFMREEIALELYKRAVSIMTDFDQDYRPVHAMDSQGLVSFIGEIKGQLQDFGMSIERGREDTKKGKLWWVLVNNEPGGTGIHASDYQPIELTFFRDIIFEIVQSYPAMSVGSLHALRIAGEMDPKLAKSAADALLGTFVSRGYLARSNRGRYRIGPRGSVELETYLKKEYEGNVYACNRCSKLVLIGKACAAPDCDVHLHTYCLDPLVRRAGDKAVCPGCRCSFQRYPVNEVGEKAVSRNEDEWRGNSRQKKKKRPSKATSRRDGDEEDETEEEEDDEEEPDLGDSQAQIAGSSEKQIGQAGAGPSGWVASSKGKRQRKSVVLETQIDSD